MINLQKPTSTKKISSEELQEFKQIQETLSGLIFQLGELQAKKITISEQYKAVLELQKTSASKLVEKYGNGTLNPQTGEITLVEETPASNS